jgi:hypothetical protein
LDTFTQMRIILKYILNDYSVKYGVYLTFDGVQELVLFNVVMNEVSSLQTCYPFSTAYRHFEGLYYLHLQGQRLFVTEDGESKVLRIFGNCSPKDTASQSRRLESAASQL